MQSYGVTTKLKPQPLVWVFGLATCIPALVLLTGMGGLAQSPHPESGDGMTPRRMPDWQRAAGGTMQFDVASVRPIDSGSKEFGNVDLDPSDYFRYQGGPVRLRGLLVDYIFFAYKLDSLSEYKSLSEHLPNWAQTQQFVVEARAPGNPTKDQIRLMVQALLAERFGLQIHAEEQQGPIYALVLEKPGKPGPGLTLHPDDHLCTKMPDKDAPKPKDVMPPYCGAIAWPENDLTHFRIMDYSMEQIGAELMRDAFHMAGLDPRPVLDRTGLEGRWDLNIRFVRPKRGQGTDSEADTPGLGFLDALQRDTGLKLVKETGPVVTYVVDAVHPASEN